MENHPTPFDLSGRTALITGSSRGLGWSTARCLADLGATVAINGRNEELVTDRCEAIRAVGGQAISASCDVTDGAALDTMIDDVIGQVGAVDIFVSSAAQFLVRPIEDTTDQEINTLFDGKLFSAMAAARRLTPSMRERGWGRIVLMSSIGIMASGGLAPVDAAASAALSSFAKALSTSLAPHGVTANAIAPGFMQTDTTAIFRQEPGQDDWITTRVPAGRWGRPDEIGWPAAFLCTPAASFITGHTLVIDGGITSSY
ncbi:MAG: gluconate 5-dehydrogenase [Rhodospirillaceae bacterium]|nr:gluconate 5-dehydrogenase [Rhodospirillaceae bacterium]|tara:strand:+ start:29559 stop:30332 length:774 start_codon:yes stop_codon:yes gene_type:complete